MNNHPKSKSGFTLIELLVVISIIALLVSILLPALNKARSTAERVLCLSNLHNIGIGMAQYANDNNSKLPPQCWWGAPGHTYVMYWDGIFSSNANTNTGQITLLKAFGLGGLISAGLMDDQKSAFYCPCLKMFDTDGENHHILAGNIHPQTGDWWINGGGFADSVIMSGYMYFKNNIKSYDKMAAKSYVYDLILNRTQVPHAARGGGQPTGLSALYGDGHVEFNTNSGMFEEEMWGALGDWSDTPENKETLWFPILSILGNNVPNLADLGGNWNNFVCNETREEGARTDLGNWVYDPSK